jgi:arylsulfatase A-like enzyme
MSDQWRWDTLYQTGHACRTPHLDRLAGQGVAFTNAFTCCPLCSPARGALFTGKWPHQTGLMDNVAGGSYYPHGKLHPAQVTYLERLRDKAGYALAYAGKWHMGNGTLLERGIENVRLSDGGAPGSGRWPVPSLDGETLPPFYGSFSQGVGRDQAIIEQGMAQIEELAQGDRPFCAVISTYGPHFPHYVPRTYADLYTGLPASTPAGMPDNYCPPFVEAGKPKMQSRPYWPCQNTLPLSADDWRRTCQHYWGYCTHLDEQYGRLLARLDELGIAQNTVVAFAVDHGEMLGAHGNFDKGPYLYEEIMRIPMIVRDPQGRRPRNAEGFVNLRDLYPTLISLAGAGDVLTYEEHARSYWATDADHTFYGYDNYQGREFKLRGIRTARYKYNWSPHDLDELYDLERDPGERANLIDQPVDAGGLAYAGVRAGLHARLMDWMEAEGDYLLCCNQLRPVGSYVDGRAWEEQHDPGWSEADWAWYRNRPTRS